MRLFEIESKPLVPVRSARFAKHFDAFARAHPELRQKLADFIAFKTRNPRQQHSRKDTAFHNHNLKGYLHEHLILGKVIIIYSIGDGQLRLCDCIEHKDLDGAAKALCAYVAGLTPSSYERVANAAPVAALTHEEKQEIIKMVYEFTQEEPDVLRKALRGEWSDFFEWSSLLVDKPADAVFVAFGGKNQLTARVKEIVQSML